MKSTRYTKSAVGTVALLGVLSACGPVGGADLSESTSEVAQTLVSSAHASQLDITPPSFTAATVTGKAGATNADYVQSAKTFAASNATRYALPAGAPDWEALSVKRSLLGVHVTLQERVNGVPVVGSTFTVSFELSSGKVYRAHTTVSPHQAPAASKAAKSEDDAYDAAWRRLGVTGDLLSSPRSALTYVPDGASLRLAYRVNLHVSAPAGAWQIDVDALTGTVLAVVDTSLSLKETPSQPPPISTGPVADRRAAFAKRLARDAEGSAVAKAAATTVDGTGKVFNPDPITRLNDTTLHDESPASAFTNAYQTVTLRDITLSGGIYTLEGPWVKIVDWESPNTSPTATSTGKWTKLRGDNGFNDVMTYFHIDTNQRYIQSLGFTDIQAAPIQADSDGFGGDDNSKFVPPDTIAFGHGGVDDNEDADVILHEYSHAINHGINTSWGGGDMGAMGEGFGDYWAASSTLDTAPANFDNAKVFTWDANGTGTWPGRRADRTNLVYDPNVTYVAHSSIPGGTSDELWSTPLFQALVALRAAGVSKAQVDTIILEAQYGLGSALTMRQMATAIVATAKKLYPMGAHAGILSNKFFAQNILTASDWSLFTALYSVAI